MGILYSIAFGYCLYPKDGIGGKTPIHKNKSRVRFVIDLVLSHHHAALF